MIDSNNYRRRCAEWLKRGLDLIETETDDEELATQLYNVERALVLIRREACPCRSAWPIDHDDCSSNTIFDLAQDVNETLIRVIMTIDAYENALGNQEIARHRRAIVPLQKAQDCLSRTFHERRQEELKQQSRMLWRQRNPELPFVVAN